MASDPVPCRFSTSPSRPGDPSFHCPVAAPEPLRGNHQSATGFAIYPDCVHRPQVAGRAVAESCCHRPRTLNDHSFVRAGGWSADSLGAVQLCGKDRFNRREDEKVPTLFSASPFQFMILPLMNSSFSIHHSEQLPPNVPSQVHACRRSCPQPACLFSHIIPSRFPYVKSGREVSSITLCDVYSTQLSNVSWGCN